MGMRLRLGWRKTSAEPEESRCRFRRSLSVQLGLGADGDRWPWGLRWVARASDRFHRRRTPYSDLHSANGRRWWGDLGDQPAQGQSEGTTRLWTSDRRL